MGKGKIHGKMYDELETLIRATEEYAGKEGLAAYYEGLASNSRVKDRDKRYRWDLFWAIRPATVRWAWSEKAYKTGCLDIHIDTALKKIVSTSELFPVKVKALNFVDEKEAQ